MALSRQFHHRDVPGQGLLGQFGGLGVADVGTQGRDDAGAFLQQVLAVFLVGSDPFYTVDPQGVGRFPKNVDALAQSFRLPKTAAKLSMFWVASIKSAAWVKENPVSRERSSAICRE